MTLYELIENIKNLGKSEPNVSFVTQGDIYELNHQQDIDYPAFVVTQGTHFGSSENGLENYGLTLFLVDRLTSDKSNELDVQSWADTGLKNIISRIEEHNLGVIQGQYTVQTFTEKFDSLCAGAYVSLNIQVQVLECNCCENKIDLVTSVNGQTGDVIIKGYEGAIVYSVNGKTGDVVIDIPDAKDYVSNSSVSANYAKKTELNSYLLKKDYKAPDVTKSYVDNRDNIILQTVESNYIKKGEVPTNVYTKDETYNRTEIDIKIQEHTSGVTSVNGSTGDVIIDIPSLDGYATETYVEDNYAKKGEIPPAPTDYVKIADYNKFVQDQAAIDESQNTAIEAHRREISELTDSLSGVYSKSDVDDLFTVLDSSIVNNYYNKTETYTKTEVNGLIEDISVGVTKHINITQADYDKLSEEEKMNGDVYCIIDAVNFDDFVTTEDLSTKLADYATTDSLSNYIKTSEISTYLSGYATTDMLNNYAEKSAFVYDPNTKTLDIRII